MCAQLKERKLQFDDIVREEKEQKKVLSTYDSLSIYDSSYIVSYTHNFYLCVILLRAKTPTSSCIGR